MIIIIIIIPIAIESKAQFFFKKYKIHNDNYLSTVSFLQQDHNPTSTMCTLPDLLWTKSALSKRDF